MKPLREQSWEELGAAEHESGSLLFPAKLRRRNTKGEVREEPVMVRIPTPADHIRAQARAVPLLVHLGINVKEQRDLHKEHFLELLRHAEDLCLLSASIRGATPPYAQHSDPEELVEIDEGCLKDIKERIEYFKQLIDPRDTITTDDEFWSVLAEVARKRNVLPLADIAGHELPSFILRMALEALKSRTESSSGTSSST